MDSYMFAHKYLVRELLQGNNPQDLKRQYVAKRKSPDNENRKENKKNSVRKKTLRMMLM